MNSAATEQFVYFAYQVLGGWFTTITAALIAFSLILMLILALIDLVSPEERPDV